MLEIFRKQIPSEKGRVPKYKSVIVDELKHLGEKWRQNRSLRVTDRVVDSPLCSIGSGRAKGAFEFFEFLLLPFVLFLSLSLPPSFFSFFLFFFPLFSFSLRNREIWWILFFKKKFG